MTGRTEAAATAADEEPPPVGLKGRLRDLYFGSDRKATRFQLAQCTFDLVTVGFFVLTSFQGNSGWLLVVDLAIGSVLLLDLMARLHISPRPLQYLMRPLTLVDVVVIASLLLPDLIANLGFLRVLRALRLLRSYNVLQLLEAEVPLVRRNMQVARASVNLLVFVFIVSAIVFVQQRSVNPDINHYLDALYFTIATLTTTGFGDITLVGTNGRLLAIVVMICGISLFLNLVSAVFRPKKVHFPCPRCALQQHDLDAVHCKACGQMLQIPDPGD